ncbi:MAG: choline ABC transporter permease subunit [Pseudomonadota bacterium]
MEWLTDNKIPVGRWVGDGVDWMTDNLSFIFDAMETFLEAIIDGLLAVLQWPHPLIMTVLVTLAAFYLRRSLGLAIGAFFGLLFILNQGYWEAMTETLALVLAASAVCMVLGVPAGICLAHRKRAYAFARPVLDLMQTLPTFVYLIPAIIFFGIGMVTGLVATIVFVIPAAIRNTQLGIASTPADLMEAGNAFGATRMQRLWTIELPHALPNIMAGLTQTIMLSLSMVVIAALVGASGLGTPVVRALNTANSSLGFEAGLVIVVVAILLDRLLTFSAKRG